MVNNKYSKKVFDKLQCCSMKCASDYKKEINRTIFICPNCNKELILQPYKAKHRKYCSVSCQMKYEFKIGKRDRFKTGEKARTICHKKQKEHNWLNDKSSRDNMRKSMQTEEYHNKQSLSKQGSNNPMFGIYGKNNLNWKGNTNLYNQIRKSSFMSHWRLKVFERDKFTCQHCGDSRGGNLNAHHIKQFHHILEEYNIKTIEEAYSCLELWNIINGLTLCKKCHIKVHSK